MNHVHAYTLNWDHDITIYVWSLLRNHFHQLLAALPDESPLRDSLYSLHPLRINRIKKKVDGRDVDISTNHGIFFNGHYKEGLNNDPFLFCRTQEFQIGLQRKFELFGNNTDNNTFACDTGGKPYEFMVMATMILIHHYILGAKITSGRPDEDWKTVLDWVNQVTGICTDMPSIIYDLVGLREHQTRQKKKVLEIPVEGNFYF